MTGTLQQAPHQGPKNPIFAGDRLSPTQTRFQSSFATQAVSNLLKTSLGPKGLDKMLVNEVGDITVTNDGATILKQIDISDPIARLLAQMSRSQDSTAGDGTTSVAIIAAELIKNGVEMIQNGLHPSVVTSGYIKACKESISFLKSYLSVSPEIYEKSSKKRNMLTDSIITSLNSKSISSYSTHFSSIVAESALNSPTNSVDSIQILMRAGGSVEDSKLLNGYSLSTAPLNEKLFNLNSNIIKGKVILCSFNFNPRRLELGVKINLDDPATINLIKQKEQELPLKLIKKLKENKIVGIISGGTFSKETESCLIKNEMFALRRVEYEHLHRFSKIFNTRIFSSADSLLETDFSEKIYLNESNKSVSLLHATEIETEKVNIDEGVIMLIKPVKSNIKSILLRGPNEYVLQEVERSVHDALCVAKNLIKRKGFEKTSKVVAGGGSTECAISTYLESLSNTYSSMIRISMKSFGEALMVIPETLAVNVGINVVVVIGELKKNYRKFMERVNVKECKTSCCEYMGVGEKKSKPVEENMLEKGVVEPLINKIKQLELATEAALTVLRVDECVKLYPKEMETGKRG